MKRKCAAFGLLLALAAAGGVLASCRGGTSQASGRLASLKPEPSVTFKDLEGNSVSLASFKGKVVLVNFWATWCDACRAEMPELIDFQQKYAKKGFTVLGIATDDEGAKIVQPFVERTTFDVNGHPTLLNYPILIGNDEIADKFGGVIALPTSIVITRDGKIAKKFLGVVGPEDWTEIESLVGS
ncbi:MAG TPA: TlpA disulfide reductase family protein [Candidatus Cybelea sp.]|nr:TlpA disulfide reductase family protein [Candidatus Cybelea sp.]